MEFSNKPFLRMCVQNLIVRPFQNLKSWDAFTSNTEYLDLISNLVWRHWRKEIGVKSWLHIKLISAQLSMMLEFCLMCRKEHLAVNIRPSFAAFHSIEKVHRDFFVSSVRFYLWLLKLMLLCRSSICLPFFMHRNLYKAEICLKG